MSAAKKEITNVHGLIDYIDKKGDLHDCVVELLQWRPEEKSVEIRLLDVNANSLGLPEYEGLTPCLMMCKGVTVVKLVISNSDEKLRVYEVEVSIEEGLVSLKMLFSPSGRLELSFTNVELSELS